MFLEHDFCGFAFGFAAADFVVVGDYVVVVVDGLGEVIEGDLFLLETVA